MIKIFLCCLLFSSLSWANYFPTEADFLNQSAYLLKLQSSYFQSSGFYDESGVLNAMPLNTQFSMFDNDIKISYGISSKLEASLATKIRNISSNNGINNFSKTGAESCAASIKYRLPMIGKLKSGLGVRYRQTLYTNTKYDPPQIAPSTEIVLGDDGSEYSVDFFTTYEMSSVKFIGNFSYQSPPNSLSSEVDYKIEGQYLFTNLSLIAGVDGIYSLKNSPYTTINKPQMSTGATHLFNTINREILSPYLGLNYNFKKFAFGLLAKTITKGFSTDAGNSIEFNLSTGTEGVTQESLKIQTFKEYHIDGSVLKVSAKGNFVKIDQGLSSDVEKGMKFDIYKTDYFGGNTLLANGVVVEVGSNWSNIKLDKKFLEVEIKPGFAARGY
jgi:hypothetical protein